MVNGRRAATACDNLIVLISVKPSLKVCVCIAIQVPGYQEERRGISVELLARARELNRGKIQVSAEKLENRPYLVNGAS